MPAGSFPSPSTIPNASSFISPSPGTKRSKRPSRPWVNWRKNNWWKSTRIPRGPYGKDLLNGECPFPQDLPASGRPDNGTNPFGRPAPRFQGPFLKAPQPPDGGQHGHTQPGLLDAGKPGHPGIPSQLGFLRPPGSRGPLRPFRFQRRLPPAIDQPQETDVQPRDFQIYVLRPRQSLQSLRELGDPGVGGVKVPEPPEVPAVKLCQTGVKSPRLQLVPGL